MLQSYRSYCGLLLVLAAFVLSSGFQCSQSKGLTKLGGGVRVDVNYLASDSLEGRGTGTAGEKAAAQYIVTRLGTLGLESKGENGGWFQSFTFKPQSPPQIHHVGDSAMLGMGLVKEITGTNVIAFLNNNAEHTVIIGAHYDHLGYGDENSLWTGEKAIHNGADDNASGVAAMLELAERLQTSNAAESNNYLFIAFSGEEKGIIGSKYFCEHPTIDFSKVNYMLNMDMVGRYDVAKGLAINGVGTSAEWKPALEKINIKQVQSESGVGPSDHTSFYLKDIPVLHFFTGQHEDYHKPTDDAAKVNFEGIHTVTDVLEDLIKSLDKKGKLPFTKTVDQSPSSGDFKVTLGVIPDYMYNSGDGMRIDGTKDGRPGAKAGLMKGDIITKIGNHVVTDVYAYMEGLSKFSKGEITTVEVKRNGQILILPVTWE
ncbi:MAG: M20/M25/M40 family metallo-hydrolase [Flavobacteriales bacterium]|nr:M20/M25/M40 family metallo-hydrolase [Flavobacteriales bacterium]